MSDRPIESCYVSTATSLQRLGTDFGLAKALCLGLARQVDDLRDTLSYSTNLVERQSDQLTRLRADNNRLRDQLADLQRLADQRAEAVAGLLQQQASQVAVPAGYVLLPRKLTAENGAKALLSGEFSIAHTEGCHGCDCTGGDEEEPCEFCDGTGLVSINVAIEWPTIKAIYAKAVEGLAVPGDTAAPEQDHRKLSPEDLAEVRAAAKEGLSATTLPSGAVALLNDGSEPDYSHLNCPACGGSGHIDDVQIAAPEQAEQQSAWVEQVMEQAQVFASAWSLVGGRFDAGDGLEHAEEEKRRLREVLEAGQ